MIWIKNKDLVDMVFFFTGISVSGSILGQRTEILAKNLFGAICGCAACGSG